MIAKSKEVWITEGEKDAETLTKMGFCGTTFVGGKEFRWCSNYSKYLKNKYIVYIGDNDEGGEKHKKTVIENVKNICKTLKILKVPEPYKDLSEWVEAEGIMDVAEVLSKRVSLVEPIHLNLNISGISGLTLSDLLRKEKIEMEYIWKKIIPKGVPVLINGREGVGKTVTCLQIAKEILNHHEGYVIWLASEGFLRDTLYKAQKIIGENKKFIFLQKDNGDFTFDFRIKEEREKFKIYIREFPEKILAVFIDSVRGISGSDDMDPRVGDILKFLNSIVCDEKRATLIYIDHWKKGKAENILDKAVGTTAKTSMVRLVLSILERGKKIREIIPAKSNIGEIPSLISILMDNEQIEFKEKSENEETGTFKKAEELLFNLFKEKKEVETKEAYQEAENQGISPSSLRTVKTNMGIRSIKRGKTTYWLSPFSNN